MRSLISFLTILAVLLLKLTATQKITEEYANKYKALESFVELKGGEFYMGINDRSGYNGEYPRRFAKVKPFRIMQYPSTIASFVKFKLKKKNYRTDAEQSECSWVFDKLIDIDAKVYHYKSQHNNESKEALRQHFSLIKYARWNCPEGGSSKINYRLNQPVTHVSYNDAFHFCAWKGMRLPTEIEWEFAARGGLRENDYPWGEHWELNRTNLWQGNFPYENQFRDGYFGLSPVDAYKAQNKFEIHDMVGNMWEWTSTIYKNLEEPKFIPDSKNFQMNTIRRVLKGGSFIDTRDGDNYHGKKEKNVKIRISARIGKTEHYTAQNIGIRCVKSIRENESSYKFKENKTHRVIRLRPPHHHHSDPRLSHPLHEKHERKYERNEL